MKNCIIGLLCSVGGGSKGSYERPRKRLPEKSRVRIKLKIFVRLHELSISEKKCLSEKFYFRPHGAPVFIYQCQPPLSVSRRFKLRGINRELYKDILINQRLKTLFNYANPCRKADFRESCNLRYVESKNHIFLSFSFYLFSSFPLFLFSSFPLSSFLFPLSSFLFPLSFPFLSFPFQYVRQMHQLQISNKTYSELQVGAVKITF